MAKASDLTLASTIIPATGALVGEAIAKVAITAGQVVLVDLTTQRCDLAQANSAPNSYAVGIALNGASANAKFRYQYGGPFKNVTSLVVGGIYILSPDTPGDVCLADHLELGDFVTVMFVGTSATTGDMGNGIMVSGVAAAQNVT